MGATAELRLRGKVSGLREGVNLGSKQSWKQCLKLTVATQRLSKGRWNRGGRKETGKELAAGGERKVKEAEKVGNCDSNRYQQRICQKKGKRKE